MEDKALGLMGKFNPDYAEFRQVVNDLTSISIKDKETTVSSGKSQGIGVRVLERGSWGMASSDNLHDLESVFEKALKMASISRGKSRLSPQPTHSGRSKTNLRMAPSEVGIDQKVSDMREIQAMLSGKHISNRTVSYADSSSSHTFVNSEGTRIHQLLSRVYLSFTSVAKRGGLMERASGRVGKTSGYEVVKTGFEMACECPKRALELLSAKTAPPGRYDVIMDGRMTGLLCHEALGHACEADGVIAGSSILKSRMGSTIASPLVTIYDNPTIPMAFGSYRFDDEGTESSKTALVSKGKLVSFLHSRETSNKFGVEPTGNARAQGFANIPIVRMSNTCMQKGEMDTDELFEGVRKGIYVKGTSGGCVDTTTGYFIFSAEEGFIIENGRKKELVRDILLSGNILESLKNVDAVGNDFTESPGICGKMGQGVPVSDGGPHIRTKNLMVGGQGQRGFSD
ncbi:MAG: TldD/PmbA family protein [Candidatus Micrarchaeota archaeon]